MTATGKEIRDLKKRLSVAKLRARVAELERTSAVMEGIFTPGEFVDYAGLLPVEMRTAPGMGAHTTVQDRFDGRNLPVFQTEHELAQFRGLARVLYASNPTAIGVVENLKNYILGDEGFQFRAVDAGGADEDLVAEVQAVIDELIDDNDFCGELDRELVERAVVDGESFVACWHVGNGRVQLRCIEPDQITEPASPRDLEEWLGWNEPSSWSFGLHSDEGDVETIHGAYVQWSSSSTDWDYIPAGRAPLFSRNGNVWLEHCKRNVTRNVKRGLTDFFATRPALDLGQRLLRNLGEGGALQAAIAWIRESAPGATPQKIESDNIAAAYLKYSRPTASGGTADVTVKKYDPGSILTVSAGNKYTPGPLGANNAPNYVTIFDAVLRSVGTRWQMPEHMLTGSAENNNYASILVAENPFTKAIKSGQKFFSRSWLRIVWRALWFACQSNRIRVPFEVLLRVIDVEANAPQVEARDRDKETTRRVTLVREGIMSPQTAAAEEGLDYEQEERNGLRDPSAFGVQAGGAGGASFGGSTPPALSPSLESRRRDWWELYP